MARPRSPRPVTPPAPPPAAEASAREDLSPAALKLFQRLDTENAELRAERDRLRAELKRAGTTPAAPASPPAPAAPRSAPPAAPSSDLKSATAAPRVGMWGRVSAFLDREV